MSINYKGLLNRAVTYASTTGHFRQINRHELKSAPKNEIRTLEVFVDRVRPVRASGLASTSAAVTIKFRIRKGFTSTPEDQIDPDIVAAADALLAVLQTHLSFGGDLNVRMVDIFGQHGDQLEAVAGYLTQDGNVYRIMDVVLPLIINDAWTQEG
jgi:hypothetical protein